MIVVTRLLSLVALAGCARTVLSVTPDPAEAPLATAMLEPGTGTIRGSALIRQRGGGVVTCAGNDVFLIPATPSVSRQLRDLFGGEAGYVRDGGNETWGGGTSVAPIEPSRRVVCDAQGFFAFPAVQAGRWHVVTSVVWTVGRERQGGTLLATTEIDDGKEIEVVLRY